MGKANRVSGPAHSLEDIQTEIQRGNVWVYRTSALERIMRAINCTAKKARRIARQTVLQLEEQDYAHTLEYPDGQPGG